MEEHGLPAVCRMWEAGFYPSTVPMMVDRLVDGQMSLEHSKIFLSQLAGYTLIEADKKRIDPAALLTRLVQWTGCTDEEKVWRVLAGLAEILTQENCQAVGAALVKLDKRQDMGIISSVAGSVTAVVLGEWSELVDNIIYLEEGDEQIWRLRASFVNKCPVLADRMAVPNEGVGWICIGLARRGDGLATPWLDRLVCQLSLSGEEGRRAASMMGRLVTAGGGSQSLACCSDRECGPSCSHSSARSRGPARTISQQ